jgi:carbamoyl-phosphate synthase large subunit
MLGPEMKSTGEVMGVGETFGEAFYKAQVGAGANIPQAGKMFVSVKDADQAAIVDVARFFSEHSYELLATRGTAAVLEAAGVPVKAVNKVSEGRPHIVDMLTNDEIDIIVNTVSDKQSLEDASLIRRVATQHKVTNYTTLAAARAAAEALREFRDDEISVYRLQDLHKEMAS